MAGAVVCGNTTAPARCGANEMKPRRDCRGGRRTWADSGQAGRLIRSMEAGKLSGLARWWRSCVDDATLVKNNHPASGHYVADQSGEFLDRLSGNGSFVGDSFAQKEEPSGKPGSGKGTAVACRAGARRLGR